MKMNITGLIKFLELLPVLQVVENHPKRKKYKPSQICALCKKEFEGERQRKYCSPECRTEAHNLRRQNDNSKERTCAWCGVESKLTYCSDDCQKQQVYDNNKNPVGYVKNTEGVHEAHSCYDEVHIPDEVSILIDNLEYRPRIQEDIGYLLSCLEDLPSATYSDGTFYHGTRQYRENHKNGITASSLINDTKLGTPKHKHKPRPPNTDLDYKTDEEKLAEARKHEQPYSVWNYETGEKEKQ